MANEHKSVPTGGHSEEDSPLEEWRSRQRFLDRQMRERDRHEDEDDEEDEVN